MLHEKVSVEKLQKAILIWEAAMEVYKDNMKDIKNAHRLTWWLRRKYWVNERMFHKSFTALIRRRIQLQTAIKDQKESGK